MYSSLVLARLATTQFGIQYIPESITKQVGAKHRGADKNAGENRHPRRRLEIAHAFQRQQTAPRRRWWWHPQPQKTQRRFDQDSSSQTGGGDDNNGRGHIGQEVAQHHAPVRAPQST